jgi:hypothetical protein
MAPQDMGAFVFVEPLFEESVMQVNDLWNGCHTINEYVFMDLIIVHALLRVYIFVLHSRSCWR